MDSETAKCPTCGGGVSMRDNFAPGRWRYGCVNRHEWGDAPAAPHAAPREGEPEPDWLTERGEAARAALLGHIQNGGCSDCSALRFRIAELEAAVASQPAALDAAGEDIAAMLRGLGLGDHARPVSAREVVQDEILPAITELAHSFLALAAPADSESPAGIIRDRLAACASHPEARKP